MKLEKQCYFDCPDCSEVMRHVAMAGHDINTLEIAYACRCGCHWTYFPNRNCLMRSKAELKEVEQAIGMDEHADPTNPKFDRSAICVAYDDMNDCSFDITADTTLAEIVEQAMGEEYGLSQVDRVLVVWDNAVRKTYSLSKCLTATEEVWKRLRSEGEEGQPNSLSANS